MKLSLILSKHIWTVSLCLGLMGGASASAQAQTVTLSRTSIAFTPAVAIGSSSAAIGVTLTNGTGAALTISGITAPSGFSQTNTCVSPVAAAGKCTINVTFTPTAVASYSGNLTITHSATGSPQTVSLTGRGTFPVTIAPAGFAFGSVAVGTTSTTQASFTVTNNGTSAQTVGITASTNYAQTNNCASLAAGATCTANVTFTPTATGFVGGSVIFTYSGFGSPQTASVTGTGVAAFTVSPLSVAFGNQAVAIPSAAKTVTVTNNQASSVSVSGISISGDFARTTTCGATLAGNGATCSFSVTFTPTVAGARGGSLSFSVGGIAQTVSLSGTGIVQVTVSPTSLTFPSQVLNVTGAASTVTVTNNTAGGLAVSGIAISGDFARTTTCGATLNAAASCTFSVTFTPTAAGARTGSLTFTVGTNGFTLNLSGTGAMLVSVTPASLTFAAQALGTTSAGQIVTVKNNQAVALGISSTTVSANFARSSGGCGTSLAAGASCVINVTSVPTVTGATTGTLSIAVDAGTSPEVVSLTGSGVGVATVSPSTLAFGNQAINTMSAVQVVTVTNNKTTSLAGLSNAVSGTGFARSATTCGTSLAAAASCTISVAFSPTTAVSSTGTVTVSYTGTGSPQTVTLSGTGTPAVVVSPSILDFGTQALGVATVAQAITLNNAQNVPLAISSIAMSGVADFTQTNNCGTSLAAKASCTISAVFKPTVAANRLATLSVTDDATGSPQTVNLTGTGAAAVTLSPTSLTFNPQLINTTSAAQVVTVTNALATPVTVASVIVGAPFAQTNNCTTLAAAASCTVNVTFKPTAAIVWTGTLTMNTGGIPQIATLKGTGTSTAVSVTPTSLAFGNQAIAMASAVKTIVLANSQTSALTISSIATSLPEYSQTNNCGTSLPATSSCTINVTFTPSAGAAFSGTLTITDSGSGSPRSIGLTGTGVLPITVTPLTRSMGPVALGSTSAPQIFTLKNNAITPIGVGITASAAFGETDTCGSSLAAGATCTINGTFTPTVVGLTTGTIAVTYGGSGSPQTINVSGSGLIQTQLSPSYAFGNQIVGTTSAQKVVTLRNNQPFPITLTNITLSADYAQTNNCGTTLAATSSCTLNVSFGPTVTGFRSGSLSVSVDQGVSPMTVVVSGTGVIPQATALPGTLSYSLQAVSTNSATQAVTLKNNATTSWAIASIVASMDFAQTNNCPTTLGGGATCTINVAFAPTATGIRTGTLTIADGANNSPQVVTLSGLATAQVTAVTVTPASVSLGIGGQQQFTAMATFADTTTMDVTNSVNWTSGNPAVASISSTGLATVLTSSTTAIPITATVEGVGNSATPAWLSALTVLPPSCPAPTLDLKVLVISNGKTEVEFPAIKQILDYLGTPYTIFDVASPPLGGMTPSFLSDGNCHGYYNGIIFTNGGYVYSLPGMSVLTTYEQTFGVRQLNWYTFPGPDFGFTGTPGSTGSAYTANFAPAAAAVFPYVNRATPLSITGAFIYLAKPLTPASGTGVTVTPLLTDASGNALSLVYNTGGQYPREMLTQTYDTNQFLRHDLVLAYGLVNWVTRGIFLGDYHVYATAQVDDVFINDAEWVPGTSCISNSVNHDRTLGDAAGLPTFRMTKADVDSLVSWQSAKQANPLLQNFVLQMAFNGVGTVGNGAWTGLAPGAVDDLVSEFVLFSGNFYWMTHTYDHPNTLNGLHQSDPGGDTDNPQVDSIDLEILTNLYVANGTGQNLDVDPSDSTPPAAVVPLNLKNFNPANMVSPGVTGLNDALVPTYLYADGIRYVVTDTSVIGQPNNGPNPSPNVGIVNSFAPGIYEVPRYPNNIFYNTANWDDLQAEFQCIYSYPTVQPPYNTYTSVDILNFTANDFVNNMLKGDMNPEMFHQPNLHFSTNNTPGMASTGQLSSLVSDVYDLTFSQYLSVFNLPILSPKLDQLGELMKARNNYNLSGVTASWTGGADPIVTLTMPAGSPVPSAIIPVTGLNTGEPAYGPIVGSHISMNAGDVVTKAAQ